MLRMGVVVIIISPPTCTMHIIIKCHHSGSLMMSHSKCNKCDSLYVSVSLLGGWCHLVSVRWPVLTNAAHLVSVYVVPHHPQTESPLAPVQAHRPVDQVKHHEHDREHNQEHVINLRPENIKIRQKIVCFAVEGLQNIMRVKCFWTTIIRGQSLFEKTSHTYLYIK